MILSVSLFLACLRTEPRGFLKVFITENMMIESIDCLALVLSRFESCRIKTDY